MLKNRKSTETYQGSIIRIYTDDVHTGYVRLIREKYNTELLWSDLGKLNGERHGPALLRYHKLENLTKYSLTNDVYNAARSKYIRTSRTDLVSAVHSPYWPEEATGWIK